jgi:SAM-dependent methyltransferase
MTSMPGIDQIDAMYRGEFRLPSGEVMLPPWETGGPEPVVEELLAAGRLTGRVLDSGCGTGRNTILLAEAGLDVVGFDGAPTAIERARQKHPRIRFVLADATELAFDAEFDTVLDLGLFHMLPPEARQPYAAGLHRALCPGGTAVVVAFAHIAPAEAIRAAFTGGWEIAEPEPVTLRGRLPKDAIPANWPGARLGEDGFTGIPAAIVAARRT